MNSKVSLDFHLYGGTFTPLGIPTPIVPRMIGGVGQGGHNLKKKKFALK